MSKQQILLVEDDVNFGSVLRSFLEMNDLDITLVDDGLNAVQTFKAGQFDLCILDVMLPHVDGFTIGAEIKQLKPATPIIYLTAKNMKEDMIKGYKIGADDYITNLKYRHNLHFLVSYGNSRMARWYMGKLRKSIGCFPLDKDAFSTDDMKTKFFEALL